MKINKASYTIYETRTHLSSLLKKVLKGEEIIISHGQTPIARLVPLSEPVKKRVPGSAKGKFKMSADFDEPLPEEVLKFFS